MFRRLVWMLLAGWLLVGAAKASTGDAIAAGAAAIRAHAGARRLILLGEFHGTREIPRLVAALARDYARREPVVVALEIPHTEQAALRVYLRSDGGRAAARALRARPFWIRHDDRHDGRRSEDMLALIEALRAARQAGADIALLAYDIAGDEPRGDRDMRDRAMARRVRTALAALPRGRLLVLSGNVHAMRARPAGAPPELPTPMGAHLRDLDPASVRITARAGEFWGCKAKACGPRSVDGAGARTGPMGGPYTFLLVLPRLSVAHLIGSR